MTVYLADPDVTLYHGDVLETLRELPDGSVDCVVTSPPYWGLRDYGTGAWEGGDPDCDHKGEPPTPRKFTNGRGEGVDDEYAGSNLTSWTYRDATPRSCKCGATRQDQQLGLEATPDLYVARMVGVFREIRRVLAAHGTCWMNMGDGYNANQGAGFNGQKRQDHANRHTVMPRPPGLKQKDLVGMPWMLAFALRADGWYLRCDIVWSKPNPMPESVTDRPTKAHEMVFLLTKSAWKGREPGPIEDRLSAEDARWLALLLDAEGNICVKRVRREGQSDFYGAQIAVGSTSRALLERAVELVGTGNILERKGTNAPMFYWQVSNKVAQDLLYALYPHLIVKQRQARIAIHLESLLYHRGTQNSKRRTDAENAMLESLWTRNKECNQFGDPDLSDVPAPKYGRWGATRYFFDQEAVREPHNDKAGGVERFGRVGSAGGYNGTEQPDALTRTTFALKPGAREYNPAGRNVRSVWEIATQPYPEAHFATYPEELVRRCLLAGCPEWVCRVCGKPRERIVEKELVATRGKANPDTRRDPYDASSKEGGWGDYLTVYGRYDVTTLGFSDCGHNNYRPGLVLDPFIGSGTTAHVARKHGRHAIGIDLNADYLKLAARRLQQLSLFAGGAS